MYRDIRPRRAVRVVHETRTAVAQETVNQASISGRVIDQQGGVVPGAQVMARQTDTNLTAEATTDAEGRFRFPYLKLGPYELTVRLQGFADVTRALTLTVGSAFELPITLAVAGVDTSLTVHGTGHRARSGAQPDCRHDRAEAKSRPCR